MIYNNVRGTNYLICKAKKTKKTWEYICIKKKGKASDSFSDDINISKRL